jgi:rhamnose transport system ATP-binding protein
MPDPTPTVELLKISKSFGSTPVLNDVDLTLYPGEVHALLGENGAGKSTLVKILCGVYVPDNGTIRLNGETVEFKTPAQARQAGIAVIYQEPTLFPDLSVAENIYMGRQPRRPGGLIDYPAMNRGVSAIMSQLAVPLRAQDPVLGLSIADQQIVEIAKALTFAAKVLVMDEPTAALSSAEVTRLFDVVKKLKGQGVALLFISHRLEEVFSISQRITILRDGEFIATGPVSDFTPDDVIRKMVGRGMATLFPKETAEIGKPVLQVSGLRRAGVFRDISFEVRRGEIVALAGLVGAGRTEVARAIFGIDPFDEGGITIDGEPLENPNPAAAMTAGLALVPEDRQQQGLVMELSAKRNATLTLLRKLHRFGLMAPIREKALAQEWTERMQFRGHLDEPVRVLSGGNQQKVVLAKWLATQPKLLIVDEPTRGIDVGAKAEVHRTLSQLAKTGMGILMISSEMPEVLGMADRILVMHEGRLTGEFSRAEATEEKIMTAAAGQGGNVGNVDLSDAASGVSDERAKSESDE